MDSYILDFIIQDELEVDLMLMQYLKLMEVMLHSYDNRLYRESCRNSRYTGWRWITEIIEGNETRCVNVFRMDKETLYLLCGELEGKYGLVKSRKMNVLEKVCICLYILARGATNRKAQERFQHSGETISRVFHEVIGVLLRFSSDLIKPEDPTFSSVPPEISDDPKYMPHFKDCIGVIDGIHIPTSVESKDVEKYICKKGVATQNVMAACSFDMCFTFVVAGWEGSVHDSRIFQETLEDDTIDFPKPPPGKYYLVDAGYPQLEGFLGPYKETIYHLPEFQRGQQPQDFKELFNHLHSSLRSCIDRAFGVWKARWKILRVMPSYDFITQSNIVIATMALHNFIRSKALDDPAFTIFDQNPDFVPIDELNVNDDNDSDFVLIDEINDMDEDDADEGEERTSIQSMNVVRDKIAHELWNVRN